MALEDNKALVHRFFAALSCDGDLAVLDEVCAPDYGHLVGGNRRDLAWLKAVVVRLRAGFPDWRYTVQEVLAEDERVWALWTGQGTHRGGPGPPRLRRSGRRPPSAWRR
jgi:ketosteroid isomerase-like protein